MCGVAHLIEPLDVKKCFFSDKDCYKISGQHNTLLYFSFGFLTHLTATSGIFLVRLGGEKCLQKYTPICSGI